LAGIQPGHEEAVRHHLEAVVQQPNAHHRSVDAGAARPDDEVGSVERSDDGPDALMTERFRSFAEHGEPSVA
jgi:hypothetical protein